MKGFAKNEGRDAFFILQRQITPGGKIYFEDAYKTVGERSGKKENATFVKWLRENYLYASHWAFYKDDEVPFFSAEEAEVVVEAPIKSDAPARGAGKVLKRESHDEKGTAITPNEIIESEFPRAKVLIEKCNSRDILKKALSMSRHFSKKEEHMRHLMKRLERVY